MDIQKQSHRGAFFATASLFTLVGLSSFIPASWFGVNIPANKEKEYDLSMLSTETIQIPSSPEIKVPTWRVLLQEEYQNQTKEVDTSLTKEEETSSKTRLEDPNNLTSSFTKNAYVASLYLKQNNITDESSQQELLNTLIQRERSKINAKHYTSQDITIQKQESLASKKAYGNALGKLIKEATAYKLGEEDLKNLQMFTQTKDSSYLKIINDKKEKLAFSIKALVALSVPESATSYHVLALNRLSEHYTILDNFSKAENDPVRASLSIDDYVPSLKALFGALNNTREYFREEGITYSEKEPGFVFSTSIIAQ